jgi:class 3 adenylate cyclase
MSKKVNTLVDNDALFLELTEGTVAVFDLRDFSRLAATTMPLDLGAALANFYVHAEKQILGNSGRVVKFAGDMVLGVWLEKQVPDHQRQALQAIADSAAARPEWMEKTARLKLPKMDYSVAAASGALLAGQIGTPRMRSFDVLGEAVNIAAKLTTVATSRDIPQLCSFMVPEIPSVEVEGIELGGRHIRLYRLA